MKTRWVYSALLVLILVFSACEKEAFLPDRAGPGSRADPTASEVTFRHDASTPTSAEERQALVDFYEALESAGNLNWPVEDETSDPCVDEWSYLGCNEGRVEVMVTSLLGLKGTIPPVLAQLKHLRHLDLEANQFYGPIPPELGNLAKLEELKLNDNQLSGPIPVELSNLSNLKSLDLDRNQVNGTIPVELSNLSNLNSLSLDKNKLTGDLPSELGNLSNLNFLSLKNNQLTGDLPPELGNLSNLNSLSLQSNQLTGPLPPELGKLSSLENLRVSNNQFTGRIPPEFGNIRNLRFLFLDNNQLIGPVPEELTNVVDVLNFSYNQLECYEPGLKLLNEISPGIKVRTEGNPGPDGNGLPSWEEFLESGAGTCVPNPGDPIETMEVTLINAKQHQPMRPIAEGDVLDQSAFPLKVSIAVEFPVQVDAAHLALSGPAFATERRESEVPYTLFGDRGGEYNGQFLPQGVYTLTVTPYVGGTPSPPLSRQFSIAGPSPALSGFTLLDAASDADLGPLSDGDLLAPSGPVTFRAEPSGDAIGSVWLRLDGPLSYEQRENTPPYSLFGNNGGDYFGKTLPPGTYTLSATPYARRNGRGAPGPSLLVTFNVDGAERPEL